MTSCSMNRHKSPISRLLLRVLILLLVLAPLSSILAQGRRGGTPSQEEIRRQLEKMQEREREREARPYERDHANIHAPLKTILSGLGNCAVRVYCDGKKAALGTVVSGKGEVLTKASEMRGKIECRLADGSSLPARVVAVSQRHDLALLQLEGSRIGKLNPVQFSMEEPPPVGSFIATVSPGGGVIALGVISVAPRGLKQRGILGISFSQREDSARLGQVFPGTGAAKAGLKVGDEILEIDGKPVSSGREVAELLGRKVPGDKVHLKIRREDKDLEIDAKMGSNIEPDRQNRLNRMNLLAGPLSQRRSNFPAVLQHDTYLFPNECGGPLVNLEGKVIGINIARSGRVESYALPSAETFEIFLQLRAGNLGPSPDYLGRLSLAEIDRKLASLAEKLSTAEKALQDSNQEVKGLKGEIDELQKARSTREKIEKPPAPARRKRL
ncbi:MAG: PDZ domain-containing protein [Planctomycetota bacterium]